MKTWLSVATMIVWSLLPPLRRRLRETSCLRPHRHFFAPSILSADFARLGDEVRAVLAAGAGLISFHRKASRHVDRTLQTIHDQGCLAGLVFNPATPLEWLDHVLDRVDLVLLMSVNPGFGGQSFNSSALPKLCDARRLGVRQASE